MRARIVYAVRADTGKGILWLTDTCAGGSWSRFGGDALTFALAGEIPDALASSEIASGPRGAALEVAMLVEVSS